MRRLLLLLIVGAASPLRAQMDMPHPMEMNAGPLGIPETRMGSGTSWLPDASPMHAAHYMLGRWTLMLHGKGFLQYDWQGGSRGSNQLGIVNWAMAAASRPLGGGQLQLRAMLSAEPWTMGSRGYPLLVQSGEALESVALVRLPEESRRAPPRRVSPPNRSGCADHAAGRHLGDLVERPDLRRERPDWARAARQQRRAGEYARPGPKERLLRSRRVRAEERCRAGDSIGSPDDGVRCRRAGAWLSAYRRCRRRARRRRGGARVGELRPLKLECCLRQSHAGRSGDLSSTASGRRPPRRY